MAISFGQSAADAFRYSNYSMPYSARTMGMGGAMSAAGADPSALLINPAGLGSFRRGEFQISLYSRSFSTEATAYKTTNSANGNKFSLPSLNIVSPSVKYDANGRPLKTGLVSTAWSFGINKTNEYTENYNYSGLNETNSITDFFANEANAIGDDPNNLDPGYLEYIAYNAGAIAYPQGANRYFSAYDSTTSRFNHEGNVSRTGNKYSYSFGYGANFNYKLQLGGALSYNTLRFNQTYYLKETDLRGVTSDIKEIIYIQNFQDRGNGFGINLGAIYNLTKGLKVGLSYQSGISYTINSSFGYDVTTILDPNASPIYSSLRESTDPLNIYKYIVKTPSNTNFGVSWILDRRFMFNADFTYIDYRRMELQDPEPSAPPFLAENREITNIHSSSVVSKFGMEYNHPMPSNPNQTLRFRLGYSNQPSGYSRSGTGGSTTLARSRSIVSGGLGLIDQTFYIDAALQYSSSFSYFLPYYTNDGAPQGMQNQLRQTIFQVTTGFKF